MISQLFNSRQIACGVVLFAALLATGCATQTQTQRDTADPWEPFNRKMFAFNEGLDKNIAKPVAVAYEKVTPQPVRLHVGNFFNNVEDGWSVVNHTLQLRAEPFLESLFRFSFNTFFGMGGLVNVAGDMGFERNKQDFGKTLGRWGVPSGPYLVVPVMGPSTLRDTAVLPLENNYDLVRNIDDVRTRNSLGVLRLVDKRANLLVASSLLEEASLDKYTFMRNAYMQKRRSEIDALRGKTESDQDYYDSMDDDEGADDAPDAGVKAP